MKVYIQGNNRKKAEKPGCKGKEQGLPGGTDGRTGGQRDGLAEYHWTSHWYHEEEPPQLQ